MMNRIEIELLGRKSILTSVQHLQERIYTYSHDAMLGLTAN